MRSPGFATCRRCAVATPRRFSGRGQARPLRCARRRGDSRRGRRGDPCGRPDSRRAGVGRSRRLVVSPGGDKPVPYGVPAVAGIRAMAVGATLAVARIRDAPALDGRGASSFLRDGTGPSPTVCPPSREFASRPVGATLVVARIRDAPALDGREASPFLRDGTSPSPTVAPRRRGDSRHGRRGDPCGRPDSRRAGVGRSRRLVVFSGTGQARPLRWPLAVAGIRVPARRGDPCGRPDSRRAVVGRSRRIVASPGRNKPVPYGGLRRRGDSRHGRGGDPCGRPDSRRAGVGRSRRLVVRDGTSPSPTVCPPSRGFAPWP